MDRHTDDHGKVRYGHEAREQRDLYETRDSYASAAEGYYNFLKKPGVLWGATVAFVSFFALIMITAAISSHNVSLGLSMEKTWWWQAIVSLILGVVAGFLSLGDERRMVPILLPIVVASVGFGVYLFFLSIRFDSVNAKANASEFSFYEDPFMNKNATWSKSGIRKGIDGFNVFGTAEGDWALTDYGWTQKSNFTFPEDKKIPTLRVGRVLTNNLVVFQHPNIGGNVANFAGVPIVKGSPVAVLGEHKGFLQVISVIPTQYMRGDVAKGYALPQHIHVKGEPKPAPLPPAPKGKTGTITHDTQFRSSKHLSHERYNTLFNLKEGTKIVVLSEPSKGGWVRVWYDGHEGWVSMGYRGKNLKTED